MVEYGNLINLQITIFVLMGIGFLFSKAGMITAEGRKTLNHLIINIILPCNIFHSFLSGADLSVLKSCFVIFLLSLGNQVLSFLVGGKIYPGAGKEQLPVLRYGTICSNAGFMGSPLVEGIYGAEGLLFGSIYLIPQRIAMFSVGLACFTKEGDRSVWKRILTHPCIIAVEAGLLFLIFPLPLPGFAERTVTALSNCTTAMSMIVIGSILSEVKIRSVFTKLNFYYCFIRLAVVPGMMLLLCSFLPVEPLVAGVSVVLSGMPAGSTTAILAAQYGADEEFAVKTVFLSTLLSLVTIPLWCMAVELLV